jgi:predicted transport protein
LDNYTFFIEKINKGEITSVELFEAIGRLQLVSITLERGYDDPQAIFESLNSTGIDLKNSDLIRNYLLMGLAPDTQIDVYNNIWRPTELLFEYEHQSELLDNFFRDYLTLKLGRIPIKNEVYKEFRAYHDNKGLPVSELCQDIYHFAKYYSDMYFARSNDLILKSLYDDIKAIRMEVAFPFLMKIHDDCDKGLINTEKLHEIVSLCVSYVLRRAVCNIPTNSLNKTFATMKNDIRTDDYLNSVKACFILLDSYKEYPNDEQFIGTFLTRDIYNTNRCRYILGQLENWDNKAVVALDNLTIEHIIPQNPHLSADWVSALGDNWSEIQKKYLHTIGNLTLTAYNSEMSDSSFAEKMNMAGGFKESALRLNKYVVEQTAWGETQINERAMFLGEIAKKVWPYPMLTDTELAPYIKQDVAPQIMLGDYQYLNAFSQMLFEKLDSRILNLGTFVKREFKKSYIAYKVDTNFVDVVIQSSRLRLTMNMKFAEVVDPKGICRDVTNLSKWGNGDVEVTLDSLDGLDDAMAIIEQALRLQDIE